jgi:Family of unknown function (DUF6982)
MDKRKVIVRKLSGEIVKGYMESNPDLTHGDSIVLTSLTDDMIHVPKQEMKALFFVRKFTGNKEYSEVKFFESQPRIDGLWVRLKFHDNETIEGIVSNTIRFLVDDGFFLKPPDPNSNNRLMFVLKVALRDFTVLGVQYSKGSIADYCDRFLTVKSPESTPSRVGEHS